MQLSKKGQPPQTKECEHINIIYNSKHNST